MYMKATSSNNAFEKNALYGRNFKNGSVGYVHINIMRHTFSSY